MNMTGVQKKGPAFSELLRQAELAEAAKHAAPKKPSESRELFPFPGCQGILFGISRCGRRIYPYHRQKEADRNT